jgi:hypothetical protein
MSTKQPSPPRATWIAQAYHLADAPGDDLSATTTAAERLEMVAILSARMWELTGKSAPLYSRETVPVQVVRRT